MEQIQIQYFGTRLDEGGHHLHELMGDSFGLSEFNYFSFCKEHFDPERIADGKQRRNGSVFYFRRGKWTICYIEGSCCDTRPGSKSVFFTKGQIPFGEFVVKMVSMPIVRKMIKQMPFKVEFGLNEELTEKVKNILA